LIRIIVTDLDNTLLRSDKSISDYTVEILLKCRLKGIKIAFATARSAQAAEKTLKRYKPDIFIGYGGALVIAGEHTIRRFGIPADISYALIKQCLTEPEIFAVAAVNESVALTNNLNVLASRDSSHYKYADFLTDYNYGYLKISVNASSPAAVVRIAANYPMCDMLRYTGENLYRFANRGAVKWNAVKAAADYYNAETGMIAAFGDDVNDLEMIRKCGAGVAVENAIDDVKKAAGHMCGANDDDGVARWILEHVLTL